MDTNRIINIVLSDLSTTNLSLQENLEYYINQSNPVETKVQLIKTTLREIALNELMISKFQSLISPNNTNQKTTENGKI